eukprot:EG_transcript_48114
MMMLHNENYSPVEVIFFVFSVSPAKKCTPWGGHKQLTNFGLIAIFFAFFHIFYIAYFKFVVDLCRIGTLPFTAEGALYLNFDKFVELLARLLLTSALCFSFMFIGIC